MRSIMFSSFMGMLVFLLPSAGASDTHTMHLTDAPGNWFRSDASGTPVAVVAVGDKVDFVINGCCTNTRHTATLLVRPPGSRVSLDQDKSQNGSLSVEIDVPARSPTCARKPCRSSAISASTRCLRRRCCRS